MLSLSCEVIMQKLFEENVTVVRKAILIKFS
jgi:hypothetical protein